MKHLTILVIVAVITLTIVFIIYRPDLLDQIWLWIIGLAGPIIGIFKKILEATSKFLIKNKENAA